MKMILAAFIAVCAVSAEAQELPPPPTIERKVAIGDPLQLLLLQAQMAEAAFSLNPAPERRDELVLAYEKLVGARCMAEVHKKLEYAGAPQDGQCLEYLARVFQMDADNPVAICARDGLGAETCKTAYLNQRIQEFNFNAEPESKDQLSAELRQKLQLAKTEEQVEKLSAELRDVFALEESEENKERIRKLYSRLVELACRTFSLKLEPFAERDPAGQSFAGQSAGQGPLSSIEQDLAVQRGTPGIDPPPGEPTQAQPGLIDDIYHKKTEEKRRQQQVEALAKPSHLQRTVLVSPQCMQYLSEARKFDIKLPSAVCYHSGLYSPACISALKEARFKAQEKTRSGQQHQKGKPTPDSGKGFSTF